MTALTWQAMLLLGLAYVAGCALACLTRRLFAWLRPGVARPERERAVAPAPSPVPRSPALAPPPTYIPTPAAPLVSGSRPEAVRRDDAESAGVRLPPVAAPPAPARRDDLKRIRAIDVGLEARLHDLGILTYAQIAAWRPDDVARIAREIGLKQRIQSDNWIEQAQILATGRDTHFSRRMARGEAPSASPIDDEGEFKPVPAVAPAAAAKAPERPSPAPAALAAVSAAATAAAAAAAAAASRSAPAASPRRSEAEPQAAQPPAVADKAAFAARLPVSSAMPVERAEQPALAPVPVSTADAVDASAAPAPAPAGTARDKLQRIKGISAEVEKLLNVQGVSRYSQIATWGKAEVERFDRLLGYEGRISRENWVEQAQILAKGGDTAFSREHDRSTGASVPLLRAAEDKEQAPRPTRLADAIRDTQTKPPDMRPRSSDISSLRSVRSEAFRPAGREQGPQAGRDGEGVRAVRASMPDDLKRIRGIGVLIERKLNSMGVTLYEQIANWSADDIDRVSQVLDFKGRIERENWVEQARILSSGGQTEFSRRIDRGDVETNRGG